MAQLIAAGLHWHGVEPIVRTHLRKANGACAVADFPLGDEYIYFYAQVSGADLGRVYHEVNELRETALQRAKPGKCVGACCKAGGRLQPCLRDQQRHQGVSYITRCEPVYRRSVVGYCPSTFMWKVHVRFPWNVYAVSWAVRTIVQRHGGTVSLYEVDVDAATRWMIAHKLTGMGWLDEKAQPLDTVTNSALVTVAIDIECMATRHGVFCSADVDPIIQIACVKTVYGTPGHASTVFVLDTCTPLPGIDVRAYATERELIAAFFEYVDEHKPDILCGYNSSAFDFPYIFARRARWQLGPYYSHKDKQSLVTERVQTAASKQAGGRERHVWQWAGCVVLDVLEVVRAAYKLSSYKLNSVAKHFLDNQQKDDLAYSEIPRLQKGSAEDRARMARYCVQDTVLVVMLIEKL